MMTPSPVRKSLLRRISWLGGDRRLVGVTGLSCGALAWTMFVGFGFFYGLCIWIPALIFFVVLWGAREMYEADPFMVDIALRHFKYRKYYSARSDVGAQPPVIRDFN